VTSATRLDASTCRSNFLRQSHPLQLSDSRIILPHRTDSSVHTPSIFFLIPLLFPHLINQACPDGSLRPCCFHFLQSLTGGPCQSLSFPDSFLSNIFHFNSRLSTRRNTLRRDCIPLFEISSSGTLEGPNPALSDGKPSDL
jgi:hypothetical protein